MQLEWHSVVYFCLRELLLQCEHLTRQIVFRVGRTEQNTRHNRDAARSRSDIGADRLTNSRAGEFEKAVIHPPPASALPISYCTCPLLANALDRSVASGPEDGTWPLARA